MAKSVSLTRTQYRVLELLHFGPNLRIETRWEGSWLYWVKILSPSLHYEPKLRITRVTMLALLNKGWLQPVSQSTEGSHTSFDHDGKLKTVPLRAVSYQIASSGQDLVRKRWKTFSQPRSRKEGGN